MVVSVQRLARGEDAVKEDGLGLKGGHLREDRGDNGAPCGGSGEEG